jgi:flagellar biosynthesis protein FlhF
MQIKRFEAADMTDALRMVKREFGDDAVILSAKEVRPGGFFGALRKKSVEITAATDYPLKGKTRSDAFSDGSAGTAPRKDDFSGMLAKHLDDHEETDRVSLSPARQHTKPFVPAFGSQPHRRLEPDRPFGGPVENHTLQNHDSGADTMAPDSPQTGMWQHAAGLSISRRSRDDARNNPVAEPFYRDLTQPKTIALVGPSGVGKSTTVAKLAWHCRTVENKRVGLISLDRFRLSANAMLARVARIMNLSLTIVHDAGHLQSAVNQLVDVDVILIDTPGMTSMDQSMMDDVGALLRLAKPDEIHLVASATVRDDVFAAAVDTFSTLGVNRLLLTHMDEYPGDPSMVTRLKHVHMPASFYAYGVDLPGGLEEVSAEGAVDRFPRHELPGGQVTAFTGRNKRTTLGPARNDDRVGSFRYVANRNSELFHHPSCKSVKRINAENIAAFNSIEEALAEGFKPCRACCEISESRKAASGAFSYQRANAI